MKQILSVADFATILNLVNREMAKIENAITYQFDRTFDKPMSKEVREELRNNQQYQDLLHLKKSLQRLNITVKTPKVEVRDEQINN